MFFGDIMLLINRFIWLFVMVFIILLSVYFSFKLRFIQFRFKSMFKSVFFNSGSVSSFSILMTSLAGRIGVGSIAGVCLSIYLGGAGSIFWMWISTFFCAVITYSEVVLGVKYKVKSYGGPSYYIRDGVNNKVLGGIYSILIIVSYIGCFLCIQSNTITKSINSLFSISPFFIGLCISFVTFFCIYGGFKSIVSVCNKLVPVMSLIYIGSSVIVLFLNYDRICQVFFRILKDAFNVKSFLGGFIPMIIIGFQRGIFSNEAGIGTSSIVASSSESNNFRVQGFIQMFGIYITTLIICSATAIIILFSDYSSFNLININGIELASHAFSYHFGNVGIYILVICVILFSFSTIITGYYYGESSFNYFFDKVSNTYIYMLRWLTLLIIFFGSILPSSLIWAFVDVLVGIMVIINLYAIWVLRDKIE